MPKNCSRDYEAIIEHVDSIFTKGTAAEKAALKKQFGLQDLKHDDDTAVAIASPIWEWQSIQFYSGYSQFYQMCDAIEGATGNSSGSYSTGYSDKGVGLSKALPNYAAWFTSEYLPGCKCLSLNRFSDVIGCIQMLTRSFQTVTRLATVTGLARITCNASTPTIRHGKISTTGHLPMR